MKQKQLFKLIILAALCLPTTAIAAKKKIKIKDPSQLSTVIFGSETLFCLNNKTPGTPIKNDKFFKPAAVKLGNLKKRRKALADAGKNTKKIGKKIKAERALLKSMKEACVSGGGTPPPPPGTPTPPPPVPEKESLEPVETLGATDIKYLIEKAGFGLGPENSHLLGFANQSSSVVIDEFVRVRTDNSTMFDRVLDRLDNTIGNPGANTFPTIQGTRRAMLDWTLNARNGFRFRMMYMIMRMADVRCNRLSSSGSNTPGANPNQLELCWDYINFVRLGTRDLNLVTFLKRLVEKEAFLISSGNAGNDKDNPHYRSARILLDRLTVGPVREVDTNEFRRNYTENVVVGGEQHSDLARIARRGTGLSVALFESSVGGIFNWSKFNDNNEHNDGPETIFEGTDWEFEAEDVDDVIEGIANSHPGFHRHWSRTILTEFVTPNPPIELVESFADLIRNNGNNLEPAMKTLLASKAFYHSDYRNTVAKNPQELLIEFIRTMNMVDTAIRTTGANNINTIEDTYLRSALGWNITDNPGVARETWADASTTLESLRRKGDITALAFTAEGLGTPLWLRTDVLPTGNSKTGVNVINNAFAKFGVSLPASQFTFIDFFMSYVVTNFGSGTGFIPYDNTDPEFQSRKGVRVNVISSALPDARLKYEFFEE